VKGKFIVFEGPDLTGKSTQAKLYTEYLNNQGYESVYTKQAGGTELGVKLRELILNYKDGAGQPSTNLAQLFMFLADRAEHVEKFIIPTLEKGINVICDRYHYSTYIYQYFLLGTKYKEVGLLISESSNMFDKMVFPDAILYLTEDVNILFDRMIGNERDSYEQNIDMMNYAIESYDSILNDYSIVKKIHCQNQSIEEVHQRIVDKLADVINQANILTVT
jgi:dTMP kinase